MYERNTRPTESAAQRSLYQDAEIIRGASSAVLKRTRDLKIALLGDAAGGDISKPERVPETPADILQSSWSDLNTVETILVEIINYIGTPGQAPRG